MGMRSKAVRRMQPSMGSLPPGSGTMSVCKDSVWNCTRSARNCPLRKAMSRSSEMLGSAPVMETCLRWLVVPTLPATRMPWASLSTPLPSTSAASTTAASHGGR